MSTILKKQYETAKQLLKTVEFCYRYYENCGKTQKDFDYFYNNATSLLIIFGEVHVNMTVMQKQREEGVSIIDLCRQKFAAYEAELKSLGLLEVSKPKLKNEDHYSLQRIERMQEEEEDMEFNKRSLYNQ